MGIEFSIPMVFELRNPTPSGKGRVGRTSLRRMIMMTCNPGRSSGTGTASTGSNATLGMTRMVPGFPKKVPNLVRCLTEGVGCPAVTRGGGRRNEIVLRVVINGSKDVSGVGMLHDVSPLLSTRTVHMIDAVPG